MKTSRFLPAGTRVSILNPGSVPNYSTWDDDKQRTSTPVKRRLQEMFFRGDKPVRAEVVFIGSESERDALRAKNLVKVQLRDPAGSMITVTADVSGLKAAS